MVKSEKPIKPHKKERKLIQLDLFRDAPKPQRLTPHESSLLLHSVTDKLKSYLELRADILSDEEFLNDPSQRKYISWQDISEYERELNLKEIKLEFFLKKLPDNEKTIFNLLIKLLEEPNVKKIFQRYKRQRDFYEALRLTISEILQSTRINLETKAFVKEILNELIKNKLDLSFFYH